MKDALDQIAGWLPVIAFFVPLVVGLVTKNSASASVKTLVMLLATGVLSLANQVSGNAGVLSKEMFITWIASIVITISSHYGVWKNIEVGDSNLSAIAPNKGLG